MKKNRVIIVVSILAALCILYYFYISTNSKTVTKKEKKHDKEVSEILNKNLEMKYYPATPREVVEYHSEILMHLYSGKVSKKQIEELGMKCRKLYDEELLERTPEEEYIKNLKSEIKQYKEEHKTISTCIVEKSGDIEYKTFQSHFYSIVDCVYYVKGEGATSRTLETYVLRKDSEGKWKILYWKITPTEEEE